MRTPKPLTEEQIDEAIGFVGTCGSRIDARLIEAAVNAQWVEMLGKQEPVATVTINESMGAEFKFNRPHTLLPGQVLYVYTHLQPDDTELLRQALEALDCLEAPPTGAINHYELERRKNALRAVLAQPAQAGAEPDCRLCTHRQTWGESADPDCSLLSGCVNGSGYKPAIEIKLWRKE